MTAATPTPAPPGSAAYAHERPSLEQGEGKADVLDRLREAMEIASTFGVIEINPKDGLLADAIATITYLREANQRHCDEERLLKDARARVAELEAMVAWRPIETAPKDQTWIIAYDPDAVEPQQFVSRWVEWEPPPGEPDIDGEWLTEDDKLLPNPTHWRPLDAPPARLPPAPQTVEAGR